MRIFLVRHGESLGNVDENAYAERQDHNVPLTQWGFEQGLDAGKFIKDYYESRPELADKKIRMWYSPFVRTQQTKDAILQGMGEQHRVDSVRENYLLREQDFGLFSDIVDRKEQEEKFPEESKKYTTCRKLNGKFYARPPMGESRADVTMRVSKFKDTVMRDKNRGVEDVIIVAHGVTNRAFQMDFKHETVEWFEKSPNPGNCDIVLIEGDHDTGYTATKIYEGKSRPPSLPKDYKAAAYGEAVHLG